MMNELKISTVVALLALSGSAGAGPMTAPQTTLGGGPFSSIANGLSLDDSSALDHVRIKPIGDQTTFPAPAQTPPIQLGQPAVPDYSFQAMFGQWASDVELDAMSTGNDLIFLHPDGRLDLTWRWAAMLFSVTHSSTVNHPGNPINGQVKPGAHMLAHVFSGSPGIFMGLQGQTLLAQDPSNMGLDQGTTTTPEIDAMDFAVPLITMNQGISGALLFVNDYEFYFSVTSASASALPVSFFGGAPASGATILKITWSPTSNGPWVWSNPQQVATPAELGLIEAQEVDALGVNSLMGSIIFSTELQPGSNTSQLQTMMRDSGGNPVVNDLKDTNGGAIGPVIKITDEDDIDAICGLDPEAGEFSHWLGTPVDLGLFFKALSLSITRERDPLGTLDKILLQVSGWGKLVPSDGFVLLEVTVNGLQWIPFDVFPRSIADERIERVYYLPAVFVNSYVGVRAKFGGTQGIAPSWVSILKL